MQNKISILKCVPKGMRLRPVQEQTLLEIEETWPYVDVYVINLPVASGKSLIAQTVATWAQGGSAILVNNNILAAQYEGDYGQTPVFYAKAHYSCGEHAFPKCVDRQALLGKMCPSEERVSKSGKVKKVKVCPYLKQLGQLHSPWLKKYVATYHKYAAEGRYLSNLIVDEAHNLLPFLQDRFSIRIPYSKYQYPRPGKAPDREELVDWVRMRVGGLPEEGPLHSLWEELVTASPRHVLTAGTYEVKDGSLRDCIQMVPLEVHDKPPILWPSSKVDKLLLLSATFNHRDVQDLGLETGKRVHYIEADSCIPSGRRPILLGGGAVVNRENMQEGDLIGRLAEYVIERLREWPEEQGIIHATYEVAPRLLQEVNRRDPDQGARLLGHGKGEAKNKTYKAFISGEGNSVLVASGMYEGIDLAHGKGRFQIITKVPWPYLGEPAIRLKVEEGDEEWYAWQAAKDLLQASGRICRGPEDWGVTYIFDETARRLFKKWGHLFPTWYLNSVEEARDWKKKRGNLPY